MNNILLFFNISGGEILIILGVVYLVFGPKKIPELARKLGKGINELKRATNEIKNEITRETGNLKRDIIPDIDLDLDLKNTRKAGSAKKKTESAKKNTSKENKQETKTQTS